MLLDKHFCYTQTGSDVSMRIGHPKCHDAFNHCISPECMYRPRLRQPAHHAPSPLVQRPFSAPYPVQAENSSGQKREKAFFTARLSNFCTAPLSGAQEHDAVCPKWDICLELRVEERTTAQSARTFLYMGPPVRVRSWTSSPRDKPILFGRIVLPVG